METRTAESPRFQQDRTLELDPPVHAGVRKFDPAVAWPDAEPDTSSAWTDDPEINVHGSER